MLKRATISCALPSVLFGDVVVFGENMVRALDGGDLHMWVCESDLRLINGRRHLSLSRLDRQRMQFETENHEYCLRQPATMHHR